MDALKYLESVVYGKRRGAIAGIVRGLLIVLSGVYQAVIWAYLLPFKIGIRPQKRLSVPVISVGNITVGGTGKTPTVQFICRGLSTLGRNPAVLSYGYGGALGGKYGVVSNRDSVILSPEVSGDEPNMLAHSMPGVPVVVGRDRHISGQAAIDNLGVDVLVLDDGFQVWKLHRDLEILLVRSENPFDNGRTLPAGRLRESLKAIRRADCIIVTGGDIPDEVKRVCASKPTFVGKFSPSTLVTIDGVGGPSIEWISGKKVFALSAIGNPQAFEESLRQVSADIVAVERYLDHHSYTADDVAKINKSAVEYSADAIITTEKDAVKLRKHSFDLPIYSMGIVLELDKEKEFWDLVREALK